MIPYQIALIGFIPLAALFMYDRNAARGLSVGFVLGMLFLPAGEDVYLPIIPNFNKYNVSFIGAFIGTALFHPRSLEKLTIHPSDLFLIGSIQGIILTSIVEQYGMRDAITRSLDYGFSTLLVVILARTHLSTPTSMRTFMMALVTGAIIYAPIAIAEFRFSPQFHTLLYGYFQHDWAQFKRNDAFRPVGCFEHALKLGQFFALTAFLAVAPLRRELSQYLGRFGKFAFVLPLAGLLVSMSWGPYMLFFFLLVLYFVLKKQPWIAFLLPACMFVWLISHFAGIEVSREVVTEIEAINEDRASSLNTRLHVMSLYRDQINEKMWFGWGGHGRGRIEDVPTDSQALLILLARGWFGFIMLFGWWSYGMYNSSRVSSLVPDTLMDRRMRSITALASMSISISIIDNALDQYTVMMIAGAIAVRGWLSTRQAPDDASASTALARRLTVSPISSTRKSS